MSLMFGGGSSLQLFRLWGIRVGVHPSWFFILFLSIYWLQDSFDQGIIADGQGFVGAVIAAFIFFGCFMRSLRDSETPGEEFRVAAAGPAVTLLLFALFTGAGLAMLGNTEALVDAATFAPASGTLIEVIVAFSALANAALFALNIVPAFPLDGGRIA